MTNNHHESAGDLRFSRCLVPASAEAALLLAPVPAGFPNPTEDFAADPINLHELLIEDAAATFIARVSGDSMEGAGLFDGDLIVVNRARKPVTGSIIIATLGDSFVLKRLVRSGSRVVLRSENPGYADIIVTDEMSFEVWGVVVRSIRTF